MRTKQCRIHFRSFVVIMLSALRVSSKPTKTHGQQPTHGTDKNARTPEAHRMFWKWSGRRVVHTAGTEPPPGKCKRKAENMQRTQRAHKEKQFVSPHSAATASCFSRHASGRRHTRCFACNDLTFLTSQAHTRCTNEKQDLHKTWIE